MIPIDIEKSKEKGKLVICESPFIKVSEYLLYSMFAFFFPFMAILNFIHNVNNNNPITNSLLFLIFSFVLSSFFVYSIINITSLKRVKGLSRSNNSNIVKKIAENNNWHISSNNQQATIIYFSWRETLTDWGKQMTIIYDKNDILVNCISFGKHSTPSPIHWFANRSKVNELINGFKDEINARSHSL
ncbi:hypothetical protein [Pseudotenacibaculum haliotis]|uniref:YcxB-like protein domain-containing protein n=1 Tax=Pseudotenacibaculum haliotis TaxID=1862138 RepID=A0ABW5LU95_9FLAO